MVTSHDFQLSALPMMGRAEVSDSSDFRNHFDGSIIGQCCFISLDGTDSHIQEPTPFNPKLFSHKFEGPGVQYEVGICLQTGWIVWWNGAFPCGSYPDLDIVWQWLIDKLDDEVGKAVLADGGYNNGWQYFIMPSGQNDYMDKMMMDARVQHETDNKLYRRTTTCYKIPMEDNWNGITTYLELWLIWCK